MQQPSNQQQLPTGVKRAHRNHDYIDLFPDRVYPTGDLDLLERGDNLLFIKSYPHAHSVNKTHRRMWKLLVRFGENEHAPGSVTLVCVWGLGPALRQWVVFDHMGVSTEHVGSRQDWRDWLLDWWRNSRGGR